VSEEKNYLIVNPKGVMHVVSEAHARERLKLVGWRLASPEEKQAYFEAKGNQRFDRPLAAPFSPAPLVDEALTEAELMPTKKAAKPELGTNAEAVAGEVKPKAKKAPKTDEAPAGE